MKIIEKKELAGWYGVYGSLSVYSDGTARLKVRHMGKLLHNKVHRTRKAAMSAWYRTIN